MTTENTNTRHDWISEVVLCLCVAGVISLLLVLASHGRADARSKNNELGKACIAAGKTWVYSTLADHYECK